MRERTAGFSPRNRLSTGLPSDLGFQITHISDLGARIVGSRAIHEYSGTSSASSTMHTSICASDLIEPMLCRRPLNRNSVSLILERR
ncbi:hypothetical protein D3C75_959980 [compost metagenome]